MLNAQALKALTPVISVDNVVWNTDINVVVGSANLLCVLVTLGSDYPH